MKKPVQELHKSPSSSSSPCFLFSPKPSVCVLASLIVIFGLFQIQWEKIATNSFLWASSYDSQEELRAMAFKLREAVTFLPLKDLRYADDPVAAMEGHTWFMSSLYDIHEEGEVQYMQFPTRSSGGRVLCLKGRDRQDGARNSYGLAWPETLPHNATLMDGTTFVSYNHYDYNNIWHGLTTLMPFVRWHIKSRCTTPERWIFYHWGELRTDLAPWVSTLLEATFGRPINLEDFDGVYHNRSHDYDGPVCLKEAVVMRQNGGGMSREKVMQVYDLMRCKSRMYCKVRSRGGGSTSIGITLLVRDGPRSFKNATAVIGIFERECRKVEGCRLTVAYPHNLTFCQQVELMSSTDIVISAHGAQLSNMIFMDRGSSVMELFPKGWLELAGVGQYVFRWLAGWSGMKHDGTWRDPVGDRCPWPEDDRHCMSVFKNGRIGYNESYFSEWAVRVLGEVRLRKAAPPVVSASPASGLCGCRWLL